MEPYAQISLNILFVCQLQTWEQCDKHKAIPKSIKALSPSLHKEIPHNPRAPGAVLEIYWEFEAYLGTLLQLKLVKEKKFTFFV
mmetsp:Transcript_1492/g.1917  ORF Transcript_1492/g.1917 Transcript_1492/m.1917 type:complete len:84 (+) Transcript_1492:1639-1890(+)